MPSKKNIELLEKTKEKVDRANAIFFVDYQGLTHKQLEEMRQALYENDAELSIIKNTLVDLALKGKNIEATDKLQGPSAVLFSYEDPLKVAKALQTFFKKYNLPKIKFGVFEGNVIDEGTVVRLASLPSKEILIGKLLGLLNSPITSLVYDLNWNIQKFVLILKAVENTKKA